MRHWNRFFPLALGAAFPDFFPVLFVPFGAWFFDPDVVLPADAGVAEDDEGAGAGAAGAGPVGGGFEGRCWGATVLISSLNVRNTDFGRQQPKARMRRPSSLCV